MTLLFSESFDQMSVADLVTYGKWWDRQWNSQQPSLGAGRIGGNSLGLNNSGSDWMFMTADLGSVAPVLFVGFAFMDNYHAPDADRLTFLDDGFGNQMRLQHDSLNRLYLSRGGTTKLATFNTQTFIGRWHYVEIGLKIDSSFGWLEGRLDGVLVATYYGTGTSRATANGNTRGTTSPGVRFLRFGNTTTGGRNGGNYDDIVAMDDQGARNNDFIGDVRVIALFPTGPGAHSDFVPGGTSPAGTNWQSVVKNPVAGDNTFVQSSTAGSMDTYAVTDLPTNTQTVNGVVSHIIGRKTDAGPRTAAPVVRVGAVDTVLAASRMQTSYGRVPRYLDARPDGQAWTVADVNGMEIGQQVVN